MEPRYTPASNALLEGVTVMVAGRREVIVPLFGLKSKNDTAAEPTVVKFTALEVTLVMEKLWGGGEMPDLLRKTRPEGETLKGAGVPAGTTLNTTAMDTGAWIPSVGVSVTPP